MQFLGKGEVPLQGEVSKRAAARPPRLDFVSKECNDKDRQTTRESIEDHSEPARGYGITGRTCDGPCTHTSCKIAPSNPPFILSLPAVIYLSSAQESMDTI